MINKFLKQAAALVFLSALALPLLAGAQSELLFGQSHNYSVVFRGNGEAIVYARIVLSNPEETELKDFSFELPAQASEMVIFQQKLPEQCIRYNDLAPDRPCIEYQDMNYDSQYPYYYGTQAEYKKIQYTKSGNLYRLDLAYPIASFKSGALIISYATKDFVKESAGLYKFQFETLKVPSRIQSIQVAVDVDSDLQLKGKRSEINYSGGRDMALSVPSSSGVSNDTLNKVASQIGLYGPIVKQAKNLSPNESFVVKGEYAKSWGRLYMSSIIVSILVVLALIAAIYLLSKHMRKKHAANPAAPQTPSAAGPASPTNFFSLQHVLAGLLSALLVVILTMLIGHLDQNNFGMYYYSPAFQLLVMLMILMIFFFAVCGPAIVMAFKHGWKGFLAVLIAEFLWLVIFLFLYLILYQTGLTNFWRGPGPVMY